MVRVQQVAGQDVVVGRASRNVRVLVAGLVRRLVAVADGVRQRQQRIVVAVGRMGIAGHDDEIRGGPVGAANRVGENRRLFLAGGPVVRAGLQMHANDVQILRARQIDGGPREIAERHLRVAPFARSDDRPAADDAVGNVGTAVRFDVEAVIRPEGGVHERPPAGIRDENLLDGHHVGSQVLEDPLGSADVAHLVDLVPTGQVCGHDREILVGRTDDRSPRHGGFAGRVGAPDREAVGPDGQAHGRQNPVRFDLDLAVDTRQVIASTQLPRCGCADHARQDNV